MQNEDDDAQRRTISVCTTRSGTAALVRGDSWTLTADLKVIPCQTGNPSPNPNLGWNKKNSSPAGGGVKDITTGAGGAGGRTE